MSVCRICDLMYKYMFFNFFVFFNLFVFLVYYVIYDIFWIKEYIIKYIIILFKLLLVIKL